MLSSCVVHVELVVLVEFVVLVELVVQFDLIVLAELVVHGEAFCAAAGVRQGGADLPRLLAIGCPLSQMTCRNVFFSTMKECMKSLRSNPNLMLFSMLIIRTLKTAQILVTFSSCSGTFEAERAPREDPWGPGGPL